MLDPCKREVSVEPTELTIVQFGMQRDFLARIVGNVQTVMRSVGSTRRDEMDINNGASGSGVAFVDGIAVPVNLKRAIEVRPGFDGAFTVVLDLPAPENRLPLFIRGLQFQPHIESVD